MVYIRFIADSGFLSRGIRVRTDGKPSHVEYVLTDNIGNPVSTFGARLSGGITLRPPDYCKPSWEEWYTFEGIEPSFNQALKFNGRKYDWRDIAALFVGWHPSSYNPETAICSVLVGYSNCLAWAAGEAPPLINPNVPTWQMTTQLLYGAVTKMVRKVTLNAH